MLDLISIYKKRNQWRKAPEIVDIGYELSRLKNEVLEIAFKIDDLEKHQSSKSVSEKDTI
jgi:hypothetical protein